MDIDFYFVQDEYIAYLKQAEKLARGFTCVPNTQYRSRNKFLFGACFQYNGINYFVPVSHQIKRGDNNIIIKTKPKKGKSLELGSLRFAYMIPVPKRCLILLEIKNIPEYEQKRRINDELAFCRRNIDKIKRQAHKTFEAIASSKNEKLLRNSCDFSVLQNAYISYCQENRINLPTGLQERIDSQSNQSEVSQTSTAQESAESRSQETFYFGKKVILGNRRSSERQESENSQEKSKHNRRSNNSLE